MKDDTFIVGLTALSIFLLIWFFIVITHLQHIEDALREKKPSEEIQRHNEQLDLWRSYRLEQEHRQ